MIYYFLFSFIVLIAATIGAMAGIGGGVIIRPALDAFSYFDNSYITNVISAFCVFFVAITSVTKNVISKTKIEGYKHTIFLGVGAALGGILGQYLFNLVKSASNPNILIIVQSIILIVLLIFVFIYMQFLKDKGYSLVVKNYILDTIIGLFLGIISSFLGIGGGPINVAVLCLFFSMRMKQASINSLIVIIFSQIAKIAYMLIDGSLIKLFDMSTLSSVDQTWWIFLLILIPIAIIGSLTGTYLNKRLSNKVIQYAYVITLFVIIAINVYNIVINSIALG